MIYQVGGIFSPSSSKRGVSSVYFDTNKAAEPKRKKGKEKEKVHERPKRYEESKVTQNKIHSLTALQSV